MEKELEHTHVIIVTLKKRQYTPLYNHVNKNIQKMHLNTTKLSWTKKQYTEIPNKITR